MTESSFSRTNYIFLAKDLMLVSKIDFATQMKDNLAMAYGTSIIKHSFDSHALFHARLIEQFTTFLFSR